MPTRWTSRVGTGSTAFREYIALPDPVLCIGAAWTRVVGIAVTCRRHLPIEKPEPL
jgi:hypothetical protein